MPTTPPCAVTVHWRPLAGRPHQRVERGPAIIVDVYGVARVVVRTSTKVLGFQEISRPIDKPVQQWSNRLNAVRGLRQARNCRACFRHEGIQPVTTHLIDSLYSFERRGAIDPRWQRSFLLTLVIMALRIFLSAKTIHTDEYSQ